MMRRVSSVFCRLACLSMLSIMVVVPTAANWESETGTVVLEAEGLVGAYCYYCLTSCISNGNSGQLCESGSCYGECAVIKTGSSSFSLSSDIVLTGRIVDESLDPVSDQTVRITLPTNQVFDVETDGNGVWSKFLNSPSSNVETLNLGDAIYGSTSTELSIMIGKCPITDVCWD